jgi:hypothetical protein
MVWTIMQKSQGMLLLLQLNKQMRLMHISHHLLLWLLNVNQVYSFILMKMLMREIWIHLLLCGTYIHLLMCSACKPLPAQHHDKYLKLKRAEIDQFAAIKEKKLEDPYSIYKCIIVLEGLNGIHMGDILMTSDIFKSKDSKEVFLSFTSDALRLAWIKREIGSLEVEH